MSWLIIGGGVSGLGAATLLNKRLEKVRLSENRKLSSEQRSQFTNLGVEVKDGGHDQSHLADIKHVVLSPGVPESLALLREARRNGIEVISEIDLAMREFKGIVLGVTGTNGKSTTCAMLHHILKRCGLSVALGGNFGDPPTLMLAENRAPTHLVLELSSYQLEQSKPLSPHVSIFTSFSHDHLARHGSLSAYLGAKWRIFSGMKKEGLIVIPEEILAKAREMGFILENNQLRVISDSSYLGSLAPQNICEPHNRLNAGFALAAAAHCLHKDLRYLSPLLADFKGLPHRCELLGTINGLAIINDSKSTNVESTLIALNAQKVPVVLMMGGQGKGELYHPILEEKSNIRLLITFGASGPEIAKELKSSLRVQEFPTLESAISKIPGIIKRESAPLLFSPGCASFDEFRNYEHRGESLKRALISLLDP